MKEYDRVELIVEKECYAEDGVHKGMVGWIAIRIIVIILGWFVLTKMNIFPLSDS